MKKIFTLAIASMIAIASFAQAPATQKAARSNKIEHVMNVNAMNQEYKNAKALEAAKAEKAAAANEASATVVRKSAQKPGFAQAQVGNVRTIANANVSNRQVSPLKSKVSFEKTMMRRTAGVSPKNFAPSYPVQEVTEDLTKEMFHTWTSADATAELAAVQSGTWCDYVLNESTGMPYGNGNVDWMQYANLSDYKALKVVATAGTPRFFLNRMTANGQASTGDAIDTNNGDHFAAYVTKEMNEDSVSYTFTLDVAKIVAEQGFAHLNVIKGGNWANVTVTSMTLVKDVTIVGETVDYDMTLGTKTYYGAPDYDWFLVFQTNDGLYQFRFDIANQPAEALPLDQEFTLADMIPAYSWAKNQVTGAYVEYHDVSFKATLNEAGSVDYYATVVDTDGNTFNLKCLAPAGVEITSEETWNFAATEVEVNDFTADMGLLQIIGDNNDQLAAITLQTNQLAGTYTMDDVYGPGQYTVLYVNAADYTGVKCFDLNATVTETGATVDYYGENGVLYHITYTFPGGNEPGDEPADVTVTKDEHGIITSVAGGEKKIYNRQGTAYLVQSGSMTFTEQSGTATIVEDGDVVYLQKPISEYSSNAWVAGTKVGNTYVFPAKQPLEFSTQYMATISMRWGVITATGNISVTDAEENFVFAVEGNQLILQGTAAYSGTADAPYMGAFWDDDNSATGYGDAETVLTYDPDAKPASNDLVTPPANLATETWYLNGRNVTSDGYTAIKNRNVQVGFDGSDVYVQGMFENFPTSWVKGTIAGDVVTFEKLQFVGTYASYNIWMVGAVDETGLDETFAVSDAVATYDAEAKALYFDTEVLANAKENEIYYLEWLTEVAITAEEPIYVEPVITDLTAELPYFNSFDTEAEQAQVGIYDANEDANTFTFAGPSSGDNTTPALRYRYHSTNMGDDYAVMPGFQLVAGTPYKLSIEARAYSATYPEIVEVLVARNEAKASNFDVAVIEATEIATKEYETLSGTFVPEESGLYYFAVHAISEPDQFYLYVDNFSVKTDDVLAPMPVSDLEVVADANAELKAVVSFKTPATNVSGGALEGVKVTVKRDGDVINEGVWAADAQVTVEDNEVPAPGYHIYQVGVATVDGEHVGDVASAKAYVGEDVPGDVEDLAAADKNDHVLLSWTAPTEGENGGIVKAENLKYNVYPVEMYEFWGMVFPEIDFENPYMTGVTATEANVAFDTNTGEQTYTYFGVTAANEAGESAGAMASVLTGEAYALPFHESFDGGTLAYWWGVDYDDNIYDNEGGLGLTNDGEVVFDAPVAGWIEFYSGKIDLGQVANPTLSFTYQANTSAIMEVIAYSADKQVTNVVGVDAAQAPATFSMKLTDFVGEQWVRFTVRLVTTGATQMIVDDFNVLDLYSDNLTIALSAPAKIVAGQSAVVTATVQNEGENVAEGYSVKFYLNDVEMPAPMFETPALAFFETAEFEIELATSVFDEAGDVTVKAEVVYAADLKPEDNTDEAVVTIAAPSAQPVASVAAEVTENGNLAISWTLVEGDGVAETTEDFEAYDGNTIYTNGATLGDWKGLDLSQGSSYGWNSASIAWNYTGEAYAFGIMNFETVGLSGTTTANSGAQALMFMSEVDAASGAGITSNKYLISSELPGVAQTISFMALPMTTQYGAEEIEVLASSTTDDVNAFSVVEKFSIAVESWTEYTASLPEGTKYFALHYVSTDIFALFIDDVKYMTSGSATPTGFNVYIDENLVATAAADALSYTYTDEISAGEHSVAVTALYGDKESAPVLASVTTAIENIAALKSFNIYNAAGVLVRKNATSFKGLEAGVYVVNGVKVTVK